jgi:hypothetical protein
MLDQHRCDARRHRKGNLEDTTGDAYHAKRNHCFHRQGSNHKRGTNEAYDFEDFHGWCTRIVLSTSMSGIRSPFDRRRLVARWLRFKILSCVPRPATAASRWRGCLGPINNSNSQLRLCRESHRNRLLRSDLGWPSVALHSTIRSHSNNVLNNVRFWGESGHGDCQPECPLLTESGH